MVVLTRDEKITEREISKYQRKEDLSVGLRPLLLQWQPVKGVRFQKVVMKRQKYL